MKKNFLAGILVIVPFSLTFFVLYTLGKWVAIILSAAPANFIKPLSELPEPYFQITTFLIGLSGTVFIVLIVGAVTRNFIGRKFLGFGEWIIGKIPFARTIYSATKQIIQTLFLDSGFQGIQRVILFEFPRKGVYSLGFVTGKVNLDGSSEQEEKKLLSIFMPTSPNPTTGYFMMIPEEDVRELNISTEEAFKIIMSLGLATEKGETFINDKKNDKKT